MRVFWMMVMSTTRYGPDSAESQTLCRDGLDNIAYLGADLQVSAIYEAV